MIDVSELIEDTDFASNYKVIRSYGQFEKGRFKTVKEETLNYFGVVQSAEPKELEQFPEGDRQKQIMKFFCKSPKTIYETFEGEHSENETTVSDKILYNNCFYKIIKVADWSNHGYTRAFGYKVGELNYGRSN